MSSFTHPHVVPNPTFVHLQSTNKDILNETIET